MSVTKVLADFTVNMDYNKLSENIHKQVKICVLDWIGSALAGTTEAPAKIITSVVENIKGRKEATLIGTSFKSTCLNAALVNGVAGHSVELDDIHEKSIVHPAAPVIPAALAIGERNEITGKELMSAVVLGYEIEIRIGMAVNPSHYRFWHATGTCGSFGAAATVGKILGLSKKQMTNAFGIVGTQAAGLIETFGTMSKPLNAGKAAMNGMLAAFLAQKDFTGPEDILEGGKGYCKATSEKINFNKMTNNLGKTFEIMNCIFKRYASCGHTHGAIDATLKIVKKHAIKPGKIDRVFVETYPIAAEIVGGNFPKTVAEAKFSLPYCIATALVYGGASLSEFAEEKIADPIIKEFLEKIEVRASSKYAKILLGSAKVTIHTEDGKKYTHTVNTPKGYPENPLTKTELREKFETLAARVFPKDQITQIINVVDQLDQVNNVKKLMNLLAP